MEGIHHRNELKSNGAGGLPKEVESELLDGAAKALRAVLGNPELGARSWNAGFVLR